MGNCKTCKHWKEQEGEFYKFLSVGECNKAIMLWDATDWDEAGERIFKPKYTDQKIFVQDGSDYHAYLYTRHDFGCVEYVDGDLKEKNAYGWQSVDNPTDRLVDYEYDGSTK